MWTIRRWECGEEAELWRLYFDSVRNVAIRDYTEEQVRAWAPDIAPGERWTRRIVKNQPFVCVAEGQIVGFADLIPPGHIDLFFVHHQWQRRGVGRRLMQVILKQAGREHYRRVTSDVSLTARAFFERHGFHVVTPQTVQLGHVALQNFRMECPSTRLVSGGDMP